MLPVAFGVIANLRALAQPPDPFAREIAAIISTELDPSATTESLEWELDVLTEHPFHHPPPFVPHVPYAVPRTVRYLVDGPASKATLLYADDKQQFVHIASAGPYDLYRRIPGIARWLAGARRGRRVRSGRVHKTACRARLERH